MKEIVLDDIPLALGKKVTTTHWLDTNSMHFLITGRSLTGTLLLCNQTPVYWFSKKQIQQKFSTNASEFIAACI